MIDPVATSSRLLRVGRLARRPMLASARPPSQFRSGDGRQIGKIALGPDGRSRCRPGAGSVQVHHGPAARRHLHDKRHGARPTAWFFSHPEVVAAVLIDKATDVIRPRRAPPARPRSAPRPTGAVVLPGGKAAHNAPASGCPPRCAVIFSCVFAAAALARPPAAPSAWSGTARSAAQRRACRCHCRPRPAPRFPPRPWSSSR